MPPDSNRNGDRENAPSHAASAQHAPAAEHVSASPSASPAQQAPTAPHAQSGQSGQSAQRSVPAFYKRRKRRGHEIGQVLLQMGAIRPEQLREALKIQQETGGLIGAILDKMGACDAQAIAQALIEQVHLTGQLGQSTFAYRARENPSIIGLRVPCKPGLTLALLVAADVFGLAVAAIVAQLLVVSTASSTTRVLGGIGVTLVCLGAFAVQHLYSVTPPSPPDEIRRVTQSVSLVYAGLYAIALLENTGFFAAGVRHRAWIAGWLLTVSLVPVLRGLVRAKFAKRPWWGSPIVVLGAGRVGRTLVGTLRNHPELGLKPVAILDDDPAKHGTLRATWGDDDVAIQSIRDPELSSPSVRAVWGRFSEVDGVPVVGGLELAPLLAQRLKIRSAVVAMPEMESAQLVTMLERVGGGFESVLVIPDLFNIAHFGAPARSFGGILGVEVRRQLLLRGPRAAKRTIDLVLTSIGGILILPLLVFLAVLIKLDSAGSVFYRQKRLGQHGVRFPALKFRTMYGDGEQRLQQLLEKDPRRRAEYDEFHKLADDPRVTRIGRLLRKYSLDELPQIWNVLVGEMSLVGPRPYLEREIPDMGQQEGIILRVRPGITGIWQVTERNATGFDHRLQTDVEYVRNWSPWLDIYVLARTFLVVLEGTGS
jgi:lipopolysaccharide/colanic/teichoic acid biosynthesis glycosyltransferase